MITGMFIYNNIYLKRCLNMYSIELMAVILCGYTVLKKVIKIIKNIVLCNAFVFCYKITQLDLFLFLAIAALAAAWNTSLTA